MDLRKKKMKLVKTNNTTNWKDIDDGDNQKLEDKMIIQLSNMIKKLERPCSLLFLAAVSSYSAEVLTLTLHLPAETMRMKAQPKNNLYCSRVP